MAGTDAVAYRDVNAPESRRHSLSQESGFDMSQWPTDSDRAVSWTQTRPNIWTATRTEDGTRLGIVSKRRPNSFVSFSASCHDLGSHQTLAAAKTALEVHVASAMSVSA